MNNQFKGLIAFFLFAHVATLFAADISLPKNQIKQKKQSYVFPDPEIPTLANTPAQKKHVSAEVLFEQKLWNLLSAGKLNALNNEMSQRQKLIANWQPPAWLKVELARAKLDREINAIRTKPKKLIHLYTQHPEIFSCRFYYNLWSLADAYQAEDKKNAAKKIHHQILSQCRNPKALITTLDRVFNKEGGVAALSAMTQVLKRKGVRLASKKIQQRRYDWSSQHAFALRDEKKFKQAAVVLASIHKLVVKRRDQSIARIIAWNYRELGKSKKAIVWFRRVYRWGKAEEDYLNLLQARWQAGEHSDVVQLLQKKTLQQKKSQRWAADVLRGEAAKRFKQDKYSSALSLLDKALEYDSLEPVSIISLRGWAYYLSRQYTKAYNTFADFYRRSKTDEEEKNAVNGLLHSTYQSKKWSALVELSKEKPGLLLSDKKERDILNRLVAGALPSSQITVENGRFEEIDVEEIGVVAQALNFVEGLPGYTWGELRNNFGGKSTISYLVNQGIDWVVLPGNIMLNTFIEYRAINNEWSLLNEDTEGVAGIDFYYKPFHAGVEYILDPWRGDNAGRYYLSWYHDWYKYMRRRRMRDKNWLDVDAYTGSTYGRITQSFNGGSTIQGYVTQGVDWFTFAEDITLNTSVSYRFRFRSFNNLFYDAHGPVIAVELQKSPFTLGMDYSWSISPPQGTTEQTLGLYFKWYYGWDLK